MSQEKPQDKPEKPEIVVDEDWKVQAEAEKEKLAKQEQPSAPAGARRPGQAARPGREDRGLPPASFTSLVTSLVTQAFFALGSIEDPQTGQRFRDLDLAKFHIDTLSVLEEKSKGNLTPEEKQTLDNALYEVRMAYVRAAGVG
ncbi:MAG: hypothetical protein AMJ81_07725 [Phycisphaerae bacterium SM23_33]|jgi:hypothetical protein|nr:MAG: hypothetical protein AMJ81_07725 [Phycisphaerae bacterium SM23_33]